MTRNVTAPATRASSPANATAVMVPVRFGPVMLGPSSGSVGAVLAVALGEADALEVAVAGSGAGDTVVVVSEAGTWAVRIVGLPPT